MNLITFKTSKENTFFCCHATKNDKNNLKYMIMCIDKLFKNNINHYCLTDIANLKDDVRYSITYYRTKAEAELTILKV